MSKLKKILMIPASLLLLMLAGICFALLYLSWNFTFPEKTVSAYSIMEEPALNRGEYVKPVKKKEVVEAPTPPPRASVPPYHMRLDMAKVQSYHKTNPDVVGWIKIADTVIDYPIMQNGDNDYYVGHSWNGAASHAGAIFADFRCNLQYSDNTLVYGHNMGNGSMFHAIKNYKVASWGNAHPYIEVATLEHRYLYKVFSCNVLNGEAGAKFQYWNYIGMNRGDYRNFTDAITNTAAVWYGDSRQPPKEASNKFITLQTCNSGASDGIRCVLFAYRIAEK